MNSRKCERVRGEHGACVLRRYGVALTAGDERAAGHRPHDVDVFPAAVAAEVGIVAGTNTFFAAVGYLEAQGYIDPSPNATLVGATDFRITEKGMAWLETPPPEV
jgi:hypothetical protein